nr:MAG TPA: hypothetical protein [Caudoviricetes sp.]
MFFVFSDSSVFIFIRQRLKPEKACCTAGFLYTTRQLNKRILATHKYNIAIV